MMLVNREFINELDATNEPLFKASEIQVEAFFKSNPSNQALIAHFSGRCVNEHMNMVAVAQRLLEAAPAGDREVIKRLARQILDEAIHFDLVAEVVERLTGDPLDIQALIRKEKAGGSAKGARVLENLDKDDLLGLYTYQFIAEGRAHRVWQKMAEVIDDPRIAQAYQRIANDEKAHREFGRSGLEAVVRTAEDQKRAQQLADEMRHELYKVSCMNCVEVPEARELCVRAYGSRYLKH